MQRRTTFQAERNAFLSCSIALPSKQSYAKAHYYLGLALRRSGRTDEAIKEQRLDPHLVRPPDCYLSRNRGITKATPARRDRVLTGLYFPSGGIMKRRLAALFLAFALFF